MLKNLINRVLHKVAYVAPGGKRFRPWLHRRRGAHIGRDVWISQYVYIDEIHPEGVTIGDNCTIGLRTSIFSHFYWGPKKENNSGKVVIEKNVFVGPHCVILPNVRKGKGDVRAERAWRRRESWGRVYNVGVLRKRRVGCWEMGAIEVGPSQVVEFMSLF